MKKVLILTGLILMIISCTTNRAKEDTQFAGEINGQLIDRSVYTTNFLYNYRKYSQGNKNYRATDKQVKLLEDITWEELIRTVILSQYVEKHNLSVTQEEVNDSLLTNPPKAVLDSGYFSSKGKFDFEKYKKSILTNEPINTEMIKNNYFQGITLQKIQKQLIKEADISRSDVEKYYQKNYSTADIILLQMDLNSFNPTVTNTEVKYVWESDKSKYFYEPSLSIKYIIQDIEPTQNEILQTKATIDSLYFSLSKGGDFDSAVREYSSNLNLYPLGKLPFLKIENVPEIIRSYVVSAEVGDVISPVKKNNVWYVYKVLEKTKTMVKLQELKHPVQISPNTILQRREEFMQLTDLINQIGIVGAGNEYGWDVHSAENLNRQRTFVEGLGDLTDLINDSYDKADGYIYPPIYNKNERFLVMVQIVENKLNKKKELDLVFDEIKSELLLEKQFDLVSDKLRSLAENYKDIDLDQLTDVTYTLIDQVAKDTKLTENDFSINHEILSLSSKGDYTKCYKDDNTAYLAILLKKNKADKDYFKKNYYILQGEFRKNALTNYFDVWLDKQVKHAKVKKWFNMKDVYKGKY